MAISRFIVMATLQAARASVLGLDKDTAYSWGLNRSIFYAAAKHGFRSGYSKAPSSRKTSGKEEEKKDAFYLGDELAFTEQDSSGKLYFVIGEKSQTSQDFQRQIISRFGGKFDVAWSEALDIVRAEDQENLLSQSRFYEQVYKPRRDPLAEKWTEMTASEIEAKRKSSIHKARLKVKAS